MRSRWLSIKRPRASSAHTQWLGTSDSYCCALPTERFRVAAPQSSWKAKVLGDSRCIHLTAVVLQTLLVCTQPADDVRPAVGVVDQMYRQMTLWSFESDKRPVIRICVFAQCDSLLVFNCIVDGIIFRLCASFWRCSYKHAVQVRDTVH